MLKKNGQPWIPRGPRGSGNDLIGNEALAYRAALLQMAVEPALWRTTQLDAQFNGQVRL
jgi:hypothetical protein